MEYTEEENKEAFIILNDFKEGKIERDKLEHYSKGGFKLGYFYTIDIQKAIGIVQAYIKKQQEEIEKKDKIIGLMTEDLYGLATAINEEYAVEEYLLNRETIKKYYEGKEVGE